MKHGGEKTMGAWLGLYVCGVLVWLSLLPAALALDPGKSVFQSHCQSWTRQSGLASGGINAITQTRDGFIWFGTQKQLVRFDGMEFKFMPLPQNPLFRRNGISSLFAAPDGGLWFGIPGGAFGVYRPDNGFAVLTNQPWVNSRMRVSAVVASSDGSIWIGSGESVFRWTSKSNAVETFDFAKVDCGCLYEDSNGRIWVSMLGQGVFYYERGRMVRFPDPELTNAFVFGIVEDRDGHFWLGTSAGPRVYDEHFKRLQGPAVTLKIPCLLADREGSVWFGTDGNGLFCCRPNGVTNYRKANGLVEDHVSALFEDRDGNIWVGTRGGVNLLSDIRFPLYSPSGDQQSVAFHSVCASAHGGFWAGTDSGLFRFADGHFTCYSTNTGVEALWLKQVFEASDGDIYLANGNQDVEIVHDGKVVARHKCPTWQTGFAEDRHGVVIGCGGEIFRINHDGLVPYAFTNPRPEFEWIRSLNTARDGSILVASVNGIYRVRGSTVERLADKDLHTQEALWVCDDSAGVIWAGLSDGLARIAGEDVDTWTQENGLFDNHIRAIIPDDKGWLWFHSDGGIFRARRDEFVVSGHKATHITCEPFDGADSVETVETADVEYGACKARDGRIWIPSPQGMILIDPDSVVTNPPLPSAHIEKVRVNGKDWSSEHGISVTTGKGELEVQYTAASFVAPRRQQFHYKLSDGDATWESVGPSHSALFANLKPGKYKFVVQACSASGTITGAPDSIEIELLPLFYQTRWFYFVCAAFVLAVLIVAYYWRIRALKHRRDWLEVEVRKHTTELRDKTVLLEREIADRKQMQLEVDRVHRKLLETSRLAGMAEVATGILHNIGNVLNSVNVSTSLLAEHVRASKIAGVRCVAELLRPHQTHLRSVFNSDGKAQQLVQYLDALANELETEQKTALKELKELAEHVDHIKGIVAVQQSYATVSGVTTIENLVDLVEDSLRMNQSALKRHGVALVRDYAESIPKITVDRHKVVQILVNLLRNAKQACDESGRHDKQIAVRVTHANDQVRIALTDNGIGISPENLTRIFNHGFTTRKDGHGFGLHSGALAAKEMGGALVVQSNGIGQGATFVLELPV